MEAIWIWALIYVGASVVWGVAASRKGRSFLAFFILCIFVTPIIGMIVVLLVSPTDQARMLVSSGGVGKIGPVSCPFCKEQIRADAVVCKHCGRDVEPAVDKVLDERRDAVLRREHEAFEASRSREALRLQRVKSQQAAREAARQKWNAWWTRKHIIMVSIVSVGILALLALGGTAISIVNANAQEELLARTKGADDAAMIERTKLNDWLGISASCGAPPTGIQNYFAGPDNIDFAMSAPDAGVANFSADVPQEIATWVNCIGQVLGYVQSDVATETAQIIRPDLTLVEMIQQGGFTDSANGFKVRVNNPGRTDTTWEVWVYKSWNFGNGS